MSSAEQDYTGKVRLFQSGRNQAVRLPQACRFEGVSEVAIRKVGNEVVLSPIRKSWADYFARATRPTEDFVEAVLNRKALPLESRQPFE